MSCTAPRLERAADVQRPGVAAVLAEAVIHTGLAGGSGGETFNPDIAFPADQRAVETIIEALKGSSRRFVHVSGGMAVGVLTPPGSAPSPVHTEETPFVAPEFMRRRVDTEQTALAGITHGVHSVV